jgi:hypothetical protein
VWCRWRLLGILRRQRPVSYTALAEDTEYDYETKRPLWYRKSWSGYLESTQDNDLPGVRIIKLVIRRLQTCFKAVVAALIILAGLAFLATILAAGMSGLKILLGK